MTACGNPGVSPQDHAVQKCTCRKNHGLGAVGDAISRDDAYHLILLDQQVLDSAL